MTAEPAPQPPFRRRLALASFVVAGLIAAFAIFRFGMLWSMHGFAQAQVVAGQPNPFIQAFFRNSVAVLWPIPAAVLLCLSGAALRRSPKWAWVLFLGALVWSAAYPLVKPPPTYYYWLSPYPSR
jgi:drug/metabolite transporter (DMT)-like permease